MLDHDLLGWAIYQSKYITHISTTSIPSTHKEQEILALEKSLMKI